MDRLQGDYFKRLRPKLAMHSYSISDKGNIRAVLRWKNGEKARFYHWLSNEEKLRFGKSDYYKEHEPTSGEKEIFEKWLNS